MPSISAVVELVDRRGNVAGRLGSGLSEGGVRCLLRHVRPHSQYQGKELNKLKTETAPGLDEEDERLVYRLEVNPAMLCS